MTVFQSHVLDPFASASPASHGLLVNSLPGAGNFIGVDKPTCLSTIQ
jgi:hypothetical protein